MRTNRLLSVGVEVASIILSVYGFATAAYWYWVFLQSAPTTSVSSNAIVLQGVPLGHIIQSLLTIALGGFIHTMNRLWPDILELLERAGRGAEAEARRA
jgi:hypothetical protein